VRKRSNLIKDRRDDPGGIKKNIGCALIRTPGMVTAPQPEENDMLWSIQLLSGIAEFRGEKGSCRLGLADKEREREGRRDYVRSPGKLGA